MITILRNGSRGEMVKQIQRILHLYPDGIYGRETEAAVRLFQSRNKLKADGVAGPATLAKLMAEKVGGFCKKSRRSISEIIVHCTATPEGKAYTVDDVRRWHRQQGWSDIGYHYLIGIHGEVWTGRDVDVQGAHCSGHNANSIGVCYVGGLAKDGKTAKDTRTPEQKTKLLSLLMELKSIYPSARIYGHRDFAAKDCPCFDAKSEYRKL